MEVLAEISVLVFSALTVALRMCSYMLFLENKEPNAPPRHIRLTWLFDWSGPFIKVPHETKGTGAKAETTGKRPA